MSGASFHFIICRLYKITIKVTPTSAKITKAKLLNSNNAKPTIKNFIVTANGVLKEV